MRHLIFDDTPFRASHGKAPRGTGTWAFSFSRSAAAWFAPRGTFTKAKRAVRAEARRRGYGGTVIVWVLP
jgi:outer membrane biosynthesis protein TonB